MKAIVTGSDHYNTLWLVRSLGMASFDVIVIIIKANSSNSFVKKSKYCKKAYIVNDTEEMIDVLLNLSFEQKIAVFASSDSAAEAIDCSLNKLSKKYFLHNCCNIQGNLKYWMDKQNMLSYAKECGILVPYSKTYDLTNNTIDYDNIPYPCLLKPEISAEGSKNVFRICRNITELKNAINTIRKSCNKIILQEFIYSEYEYLIYGVSTTNEIIFPGGLRKIHCCSDTKNLGMASYAYLSSEIPHQLGNFDKIKQFINGIGYHGLFSVEFMISNNKAYFLEINLRNDGTCFITTKSGVNLPAIWAADINGMDISNFNKEIKYQRTYGINEANYIKYTLLNQSLIKSIGEIKKARAFSLILWDDMMPVIMKVIYSIYNKFIGLFNNRIQ